MQSGLRIEELVDDYISAEERMIIVEDAMEILQDGYPLDLETELKLEGINIDPIEFTQRHSEQTSSRLRTDPK